MTVLENPISDIVVALAAHFEARERAIAERSVTQRVRMEYVYINSKLLEAAAEVVGKRYAKGFITDIGRSVGYVHTEIDAFSEVHYKKCKQAIKKKIAEKLHLIDPTPEISYKNKK